jgi:hypothetical protein
VRSLIRSAVAALVVLAGPIALSTITPAAIGAEGEGVTLSDKSLHVKKDYPPIPGQSPQTTVLEMTLDACRSSAAGVVIEITFKLDPSRFSQTNLAVSWPAPEADDVDLYLYDEAGETVGQGATTEHPEKIGLADVSSGSLFLCVLNYSGPNAGFTLEATSRYVSVYERTPEPATPRPTPRPTPKPLKTAAPTPTPAPATPTPEPVDTPGADGPSTDQKLTAFSGGTQAKPPDDGPRTAQIVFGALTGAIVLSGITLVALRIRRDLT